jgi:hypothetical protein
VEKSKNSINVEGGFLFCGGWNFSKSVSVGSTVIRKMRVIFKFSSFDQKSALVEAFIYYVRAGT